MAVKRWAGDLIYLTIKTTKFEVTTTQRKLKTYIWTADDISLQAMKIID